MLQSLFNKVADIQVGLQRYLKETPTQVFFREYCKIYICKIKYYE